jgi:hypothetical protein
MGERVELLSPPRLACRSRLLTSAHDRPTMARLA